jgi:hypothetical protein
VVARTTPEAPPELVVLVVVVMVLIVLPLEEMEQLI